MSLTQDDLRQIETIVDKAIEKELPNLLGRSVVQVKEYLIKNIT